MKTKSKKSTTILKKKKSASSGPSCVECDSDRKPVSNRIVGRVIRPGQVPRELLITRMLCEPCLMREDGKRKS